MLCWVKMERKVTVWSLACLPSMHGANHSWVLSDRSESYIELDCIVLAIVPSLWFNTDSIESVMVSVFAAVAVDRVFETQCVCVCLYLNI